MWPTSKGLSGACYTAEASNGSRNGHHMITQQSSQTFQCLLDDSTLLRVWHPSFQLLLIWEWWYNLLQKHLLLQNETALRYEVELSSKIRIQMSSQAKLVYCIAKQMQPPLELCSSQKSCKENSRMRPVSDLSVTGLVRSSHLPYFPYFRVVTHLMLVSHLIRVTSPSCPHFFCFLFPGP